MEGLEVVHVHNVAIHHRGSEVEGFWQVLRSDEDGE
jgi:hypothetical protein